MASILDLDSTSDSENDVDFVPSGVAEDSNDSSGSEISEDELNSEETSSCKVKRKRRSVKKTKVEESITVPDVVPKLPAVDEKKRANDLWQSFLEDVKVDPSASTKKNENVDSTVVKKVETKVECASATSSETSLPKKDQEPTVEKVFEFAGETFTYEASSSLTPKSLSLPEKANVPSFTPAKRGGLDSVLGAISNKKQKLSTLDKTALDWKTFKRDEGLDYDLERFNKGRAGYLERQKFLQRADLRSFEMEKSMRQAKRKK